MTKEETLKILATLKAAYPMYYRGLNAHDADAVANLWAVQFREDQYKDVAVAVHSLISTRTDTYPPVIGEVKQALREVTRPDDIPQSAAWDMVMISVRRGIYHAAEDWALLPDIVKEAISPEQIKRMATDEDFNESVEKSLFYRSYAAVLERHRKGDILPPSLKQAIEARKAAVTEIADVTPLQIETEAETETVHDADAIGQLDIRDYLTKMRGQ